MKFLVPVDFSEITNPLLATVKRISQKHSAVVNLLHVIPPVVYLPYPETLGVSVIDIETLEKIEREKKREAEEKLKALEDYLSPVESEIFIEIGDPADVILEYEDRINPDLIFLGGHRKGLIEKILVGSTTEKVVKHGKVSDFVVKGREVEFKGRIVIAYDFSETAEKAVNFAIEFLKPFNVKVDILHVNEPLEVPLIEKLKSKISKKFKEEKIKLLEEIKERFNSEGINAEIIFKEEKDVVKEITEYVNRNEDVELLIIGSKGLKGFRKLILGSTATKLLSKVEKPILIYKVVEK